MNVKPDTQAMAGLKNTSGDSIFMINALAPIKLIQINGAKM